MHPKRTPGTCFPGRGRPAPPRISVTVPEEVSQQEDLLVARSSELGGNSNTAVALTFNHALTAVRFVCGNDMREGTVKQVRLKNVYSRGTYNMGTQTWSGLDTPASFSQALDKVTTGTADEALTSEAQTFMMLPQRFPEGAQIEVLFTDDTHTGHTLIADIKGSEWPMGKTVTYKISSSSLNWTYTLDVTALADFTYTGGTQQYCVTSYRKKKLPNGPHNMQKTEPRGQTPSRYGLPHSRHLVPAVNLRNLVMRRSRRRPEYQMIYMRML